MNEQNMDPSIKVTKINNRFHSRLIHNNVIVDEMACEEKQDIGWICREMLRWFDKLGGESVYASTARDRQRTCDSPIGRVWYKNKLEEERCLKFRK